jgi:hypothetical protein
MREEKEEETPTDIIIIAVVLGVLGTLVGVASHFKGKSAEHAMENSFYNLGRVCGTHPRKFISASILLLFIFSFGATLREDELDPATLWVPKGAVALDHNEYVKAQWPSNQRFNSLLVTPKDGAGSNMLTPKYIKDWHAVHDELMAIKIDGDELMKFNDEEHKDKLEGMWTFQGKDDTRQKCFKWGAGCATNSISNVFGFDTQRIEALTDADVAQALDTWDKTTLCTSARAKWTDKGLRTRRSSGRNQA